MGKELGVVGLGHWFGWLLEGVGSGKGLNLKKVVGTRPFDSKRELLSKFGITRDTYYVSEDGASLPAGFFEGIDVVHIADPNRFHADQTIDSLEHGKYVITEKTLAVNKHQFDTVSSLMRKNNYQNKVYLHLHYLHKQATIALAQNLDTMVRENGRIKNVEATFFEEENDEDAKRTWLFNPENGGIFMDWIHPFEVLFYATHCRFLGIKQFANFAVNTRYSNDNPTGVEAVIGVAGKAYTNHASARVRVAKGVKEAQADKSLRLVFESGDHLLLRFPGHQSEFNTGFRGQIQLVHNNDNGNSVVENKKLSGLNSSQIFIDEVMDFCEGNHRGLKLEEIEEIFKPQWEYQRLAASSTLIKDSAAITQFLNNGSV